jgi:hypothetical protein
MFNTYYKFHKEKNHFNHFWSIFSFFNTQLCTFFLPQIYFKIVQYKLEKRKKIGMNTLCYNLPYHAKFLKKHVLILPWLKFKHGHL